MYEMNAAEKELVAALRSGGYKQTNGRLRDGDRFCCLGVACDISNLGVWRENKFLSSRTNLPFGVQCRLDWSDPDGRVLIQDRSEKDLYLSGLNDDGLTFNQIANIIEAGLVSHRVKE